MCLDLDGASVCVDLMALSRGSIHINGFISTYNREEQGRIIASLLPCNINNSCCGHDNGHVTTQLLRPNPRVSTFTSFRVPIGEVAPWVRYRLFIRSSDSNHSANKLRISIHNKTGNHTQQGSYGNETECN